MMSLKSLLRRQHGVVLVEFAAASLVMVMVLLTTVEYGVETFIWQSSERMAADAAQTYSVTRSIEAAEATIAAELPAPLLRCRTPLDIVLFDRVSGSDLVAGGRPADGSAQDTDAVLAKVTFTCDWDRITPVVRGMFGAVSSFDTTVFVRLK